MKFFLLVVAATCGISAAFPADVEIPSTSSNGVVAGAVTSGTDIANAATNVGVNAATAGMSKASGMIQKGMSLANSTSNAGLNMALSAINGGLNLANSSIQSGVGMGVSVVNSIGNYTKGIPMVGGVIQASTDMTANMMKQGASVASSVIKNVKDFERAKFGYIKKGISWTTGKFSNVTTSSMNFAKSGVNSVGSTISGAVNAGASTSSKAANSVFNFLG